LLEENETMRNRIMIGIRPGRFVVPGAALLFAGVGLATWISPSHAATRFGLDPDGASGVIALRADLGGLFIGLAVLCGAAVWTGRRIWSLAAAAMLGAIAVGRAIGWIENGGPAGDGVDLAIETVVIAALALSAPRTTEADARPARATRGRGSRMAVAVGVVLAAAGSMAMLSPRVQQAIFDRGARTAASDVNTAPMADDALRVGICGSSAPLPSAARAKACVAVFAGGKFYVVDAGPESTENLVRWGIPLSQIGGVLLTHFHSDHIGDLGELNLQTWAAGRPSPLPVYGGPGVQGVVDGFNGAYRLDQGYRTKHHTARVMPPETWAMVAKTIELEGEPTTAKDRSGLVLDDGSLRITAIEVDHAPIAPAYAYRFDYKGRSVVITGDLKYHPPLATHARGVDVIVSEAISLHMTRSLGAGATDGGRSQTAAIMHDIEDYHITPEQAAQIANQAGAKLLVFYHLLPAPDGYLMRQIFGRGVSEVRVGDWAIANDGSLYTLPLGFDEIRMGRVRD
jgi:ribonuclease Z